MDGYRLLGGQFGKLRKGSSHVCEIEVGKQSSAVEMHGEPTVSLWLRTGR